MSDKIEKIKGLFLEIYKENENRKLEVNICPVKKDVQIFEVYQTKKELK